MKIKSISSIEKLCVDELLAVRASVPCVDWRAA